MTEKQLKYFTITCKKTTNMGKMYFYLKFIKFFNIYVKLVISNCNTSVEKVSEFLDSQLKGIIQDG